MDLLLANPPRSPYPTCHGHGVGLSGVPAVSSAAFLALFGGAVVILGLLGLTLSRRAERAERSRRLAADGRAAGYVNPRRRFAVEQPGAPGAASSIAEEDAEDRRPTLHDPDPFVRMSFIAGLAGQRGAEQTIVEALQDEFPQVRREAVRALAEIGGGGAARALSVVVARDPSAEVREEAVAALAGLIEHPAADDSSSR